MPAKKAKNPKQAATKKKTPAGWPVAKKSQGAKQKSKSAEKRKATGKPFTKGQPSANPEGARAHDKLLRQIKHLTRKELASVCNLVLQGTVEELERVTDDREFSSVLKVLVASVLRRGIEKGDYGAFDALMNRLLGKVPDKVDMNLTGNGPNIVVTLPSNGREAETNKREPE